MEFTPNTPADWMTYILLGALMGGVGQAIRSTAGLKKVYDEASAAKEKFSDNFDWTIFLLSMVLGAAAGALTTLTVSFPAKIDAKFLLVFVAAGYAGADFIEAFVKKYLPGS